MRRITIPVEWILKAIDTTTPGSHVVGAVWVNWPELRLTEEQIIANAFAQAYGHPEPYEDLSLIAIEIPRLVVR
jgi:hypothetical protein